MMYVPGPKNRDRNILLIYGHHAMLERWWGLVENLNLYGTVTMPDMPGFGGMDSFSKIGQKIDPAGKDRNPIRSRRKSNIQLESNAPIARSPEWSREDRETSSFHQYIFVNVDPI